MLEDYFDFVTPDDIRLKGSRIGIESILYEHISRAQSPEAIQETFPSLTLEQVYAAILYYLRNKKSMDDYLARWLEFSRRARAEQDQNPPSPASVRLKRRSRLPACPRNATCANRPKSKHRKRGV